MPTSSRPKQENRDSTPVENLAWRYEVALSDGLTGVNRIVTLLRQRNYQVMWLHADLGCGGSGRRVDSVTVVVTGTEHDAKLLDHRLLRLTLVLDVARKRADMPARSA